MDLKDYFETHTGFGVLSTADGSGKVDAAVFARPHVLGVDTVAFIMGDKLTHANLEVNPRAAYLFREDPGEGSARYEGVRLFLTKTDEESDPEKIAALRRRAYGDPHATRYLVTFRVDEALPLVGPGDDA